MEWDLNTPYISETITYEGGNMIKNIIIKRYTKLNPTLILVSSSILNQWEEELSYSNLKVETITSKRDVDSIIPNNYDVILVTTTMFNILISSYSNHIWKRFIFDEPGHTRISNMKYIQAGFNWFVTASPNTISEYHYNCKNSMIKTIIGDSYLDFNTQFEYIILKNDEEIINKSFKLPDIIHHTHICFQPIVKVIDGLDNSGIKILIDKGNISEAIVVMGGTSTKNIVELISTKLEKELEKLGKKIENDGNNELQNKYNNIEKQILDLPEKYNMINSQCNICMETIKDPVLESNCYNIFCGKCLFNWLKTKNNCPLCRNVIKMEDLIYVDKNGKNSDKDSNITRLRTKTEEIVDIISNKKDGNFIIFSVYDESYEPICKILKDNNIGFVIISGKVSKRQKDINKFKTGDCNVIFLNSKFSSAGINLTEATDIIFYHKMCQSAEKLIIGRAHRIGRKDTLNIHHLI
jgi:SNF2 family DNA or RNA helicase